jgi:hypothetical protein
MSRTATEYIFTPKALRGVQIALPDGMSMQDVDWFDEPTNAEYLALRARIIARIRAGSNSRAIERNHAPALLENLPLAAAGRINIGK